MRSHSLLSVLLVFLAGTQILLATQKLKPPSIKDLELDNVSLEEAIDKIRAFSRADDPTGAGLNIVLIKGDLEPIQTNSRFSVQASNVLYVDLFYAISKRLGLGFRIEPHAVVIGSGNKIPLPAGSPAARDLSRRIKLSLGTGGSGA